MCISRRSSCRVLILAAWTLFSWVGLADASPVTITYLATPWTYSDLGTPTDPQTGRPLVTHPVSSPVPFLMTVGFDMPAACAVGPLGDMNCVLSNVTFLPAYEAVPLPQPYEPSEAPSSVSSGASGYLKRTTAGVEVQLDAWMRQDWTDGTMLWNDFRLMQRWNVQSPVWWHVVDAWPDAATVPSAAAVEDLLWWPGTFNYGTMSADAAGHWYDYSRSYYGGVQPVPEPASMLLLGAGLVGVVRSVRKRRG